MRSPAVVTWLILAVTLIVASVAVHPGYEGFGIAFVAWLGGITTDRMLIALAEHHERKHRE